MSNLLNTDNGRLAVITAQRFLLQRRLSRFFRRNLVIDWDRWRRGVSEFDLETLLGQLNQQHDTEILELLQLLGVVGGLEFTFQDMNIYVNATTGSDVDGTGSVDRPFASLWFIKTLPRTILHNVRIILQTSIVETDGLCFQFNIQGDGTFSFIGQGNATVLETGLEISAVNNTFAVTGLYIEPTAVYSADRRLTFLRMTSGLEATNCVPVFMDDHTVPEILTPRIPISTAAATDNFEFILPSITLTVPFMTFKCSMPENASTTNHRNIRVCIANMQIQIANDYSENPILIDNSGPMLISFVRILENTTGLQHTITAKSDINNGNAYDVDLETYIDGDVGNINNDLSGFVPSCAGLIIFSDISSEPIYARKEANVYCVTSRHPIQMHNAATLQYGAFRWIELEYGSLFVNTILTDGHVVSGQAAAVECNICTAKIENVDVIDSDNCVTIFGISEIAIENIRRNVLLGAVSGYGIYFAAPGRVELDDAGTGTSGTTGEIAWGTLSPLGTSALPGAYLSQNDGQQSLVKRLA